MRIHNQRLSGSLPWLKIAFITCAILGLLLAGCTTRQTVIAATGTVIGVEITQNPATQLYGAKLGYNRGELAIIPSGKTEQGGSASDTADVIMELRYGAMFSFTESSLYQRLAVGKVAVAQPGAALMFAKSPDGKLNPEVAKSIAAVQAIPAQDAALTADLAALARRYQESPKQGEFDAWAQAHGYASFPKLLTDPKITSAEVEVIKKALEERKL